MEQIPKEIQQLIIENKKKKKEVPLPPQPIKVEVDNFPKEKEVKFPTIPDYKKDIKDIKTEIVNLAKEIKNTKPPVVNVPDIKIPKIDIPRPEVKVNVEPPKVEVRQEKVYFPEIPEEVYIKNKEPEEAIPVRMVDESGEKFIKNISKAFATGVGPIITASAPDNSKLEEIKLSLAVETPSVYNVTLTSANTEYSQLLPNRTRRFTIQTRTAYDSRLAFVTGKVATPTAPYWTIKAGSSFIEENVKCENTTVYLASAQAGVIVEIICWS
jgi:hypothetical protein